MRFDPAALVCNANLSRIFPFLRWRHLVNRDTLRADLVAGLTGAVIVLPQGVAFAMIAGLPPVYGLWTAMVPPVLAALFGSSRHLISGPTTALSIVVFATVSKFAEPGTPHYVELALTLTFLAGIYQLILGMARLGALINFISHSVVVGFTAGAAVLIAASQLKHYFGLNIPGGESFLHALVDIAQNILHSNPYAVAVATVTLVVAVWFQIYRPRWPGMLIAMVAGSLVAAAFGGSKVGIGLIGELPAQLPPFSVPDLSLKSLSALGSAAFALAMLGLVEAVSIARSVASRSGQRIDGSQEFIGQGVSNIIGSFMSSYASSGSFTRSGLNFTAGAVTPMSAIFAAGSLALIVLLVAPLAAHLPISAMAGILVVVAYRLIDFHHIKVIVRSSKAEAAVLVVTFFAALFVQLEFAIYVGVMMSLVIYLYNRSRPRIVSSVPDLADPVRRMSVATPEQECPQLKIVRIDGAIFFGSVDHVGSVLHQFDLQNPAQNHVLITCSGINFIDVAGAELLAQEARARRAAGKGFYLASVKGEVIEFLKRGGFIDDIGTANIFPNKAVAIAEIYKRLDADVCARCKRRIFTECSTPPPRSTRTAASEPAATASS